MTYTDKLSITVPYALADIASKIGRGLDVDTGGAESFNREVIGYDEVLMQPIYGDTINVTTPCTAEFKAQAEYMMTNPAMLQQVLAADYAARWKGFTPPTLAECELFCGSIIPEQVIAL